MEKILFKPSNGLISFIRTLLRWKQWLKGGMLTLNAVVQTQMMLNAQVAQFLQLSQKTPKNATNFLADRKLKLREIAELKISEGCVFPILPENLSMRKLCSKWVLCLLTVDQKQQRVDDSGCCLQLFQCYKKEFLCEYVTMNETWIHHFTPESNQLSVEWATAGETVQSDQRHKHQQASFGLCILGCTRYFVHRLP